MFRSKPVIALFRLARMIAGTVACATVIASEKPPILESDYPEFAMPDNSGFTDVKRDCGAKGDGVTDDTDALHGAEWRGTLDVPAVSESRRSASQAGIVGV